MPYTQANPLSKGLRDALDRKVELLKKRNSGGDANATYYFNARTPWIRMTSSVNVTDSKISEEFEASGGNDLASKYVLGLVQDGTGFAGHKYDNATKPENSLGIRPQPGIDSLSIDSHNQFGSLRTSTVNFKVWTKKDLDICEMLYMRPGMSVLLEWGWSLYIDEEGNVQEMGPGLSREVLEHTGGTSIQSFLKRIQQKQFEYGYGYDAILGFVKNFSWKLKPDGGYDCTTTIVTAGELVESLNLLKPLSDTDAALYKGISKLYRDAVTKDAYSTSTTDSRTGNPIDDFDGFTQAGGVRSRITVDEAKFEEALKRLEGLPSPDATTPLGAFLKYDIAKLLPEVIDPTNEVIADTKLQKLIEDKRFNGSVRIKPEFPSVDAYPSMTKRLLTILPDAEATTILWNDPSYRETTDGKLALEDGREVVISEHVAVTYIKYGLLLEFINNFMLHNAGGPTSPFNQHEFREDSKGILQKTSEPIRFTAYPDLTFSIDPSVCILPREVQLIRNQQGASETSVDPYVKDILISIDFLADLVDSSQLTNVGREGTSTIRLEQFLSSVNSAINESCGGSLQLDVQYFDQTGYFAVLDRKRFSKSNNHYELVPFGNTSILRDISISSSLTPQMSSQLAISVQTNLSDASAETAGFLQFNKGIYDRMLRDRSLNGKITLGEGDSVVELSKTEFSETIQMVNLIYGERAWIPSVYEYAKIKHKKYVEHFTGNTKKGSVGQVVIPFIGNIQIDGTSGFRILNGMVMSSDVLPYNYGKGRADVGMVITGLQASVNKSDWITSLKTNYYNLNAGTLDRQSIASISEASESRNGNYVYRYHEDLANLSSTFGLAPYVNFDNEIVGNYDEDDQFRMQNLIMFHYKNFWNNGTKKELEDEEVYDPKGVYVSDDSTKWDVNKTSALDLYWSNLSGDYARIPSWRGDQDNFPWSAVYVSYMMSKHTLNGRTAIDFRNGSPKEITSYSELGIPEGYGSATWVKGSSHFTYAKAAKKAREAKSKYKGEWVAFAFSELNTGSETHIKVEAGDILITPRKGAYTNSHGDIVVQSGYAKTAGDKAISLFKNFSELFLGEDGFKENLKEDETILAGGNLGNTNSVEAFTGGTYLRNGEQYYNVDSEGKVVFTSGGIVRTYYLVLKRM